MSKELGTSALGESSVIEGIGSAVAVTGSKVGSTENGRVVASPSDIGDTVEGVMGPPLFAIPPPRLSVMPRTLPPSPELAIATFPLEIRLIVFIRL